MKAILKNGTALVAATLMTGPALAADMLTEIGPGEGQVNIVAWPGYIERAETLQATITRFNGNAVKGEDPDYGRGISAQDRYYGDPNVKPNCCLGPIETGPFYAVQIYPGDLGTKGGLVTDNAGRVMKADGTPVPGLYAAGNTTASVMGRTYPGAGGTIGPALTFGFLAAEAAQADSSAA